MADETANANIPRATTATGTNTLNPFVVHQVTMLRMWAHNLDRFEANYRRALDETRGDRLERGRARLNLREWFSA
jgi:hypothetical protein